MNYPRWKPTTGPALYRRGSTGTLELAWVVVNPNTESCILFVLGIAGKFWLMIAQDWQDYSRLLQDDTVVAKHVEARLLGNYPDPPRPPYHN